MSDKFNNIYRIPSARLAGYDYSNEGLYFITICTKDKAPFFGTCSNGTVHLNEIGLLSKTFWEEIPVHFPNVILDEFVIMPNHIHGIICIHSVETLHATSSIAKAFQIENNIVPQIEKTLHATSIREKNQHFKNISPKVGSLSTIIRSYKSIVTNKAKAINPHFAWQSRFHDHIIRDANSLNNIQNYISNNPQNWQNDRLFK
jgi:putative transposase